MLQNKAVVVDATGLVENIIVVYDAMDPPFDPGPGKTLMDPAGAEIGGTWNGTEFLPKPPPDPAIIELEKDAAANRAMDAAIAKTTRDALWDMELRMRAAGQLSNDPDIVSATNKSEYSAVLKAVVRGYL